MLIGHSAPDDLEITPSTSKRRCKYWGVARPEGTCNLLKSAQDSRQAHLRTRQRRVWRTGLSRYHGWGKAGANPTDRGKRGVKRPPLRIDRSPGHSGWAGGGWSQPPRYETGAGHGGQPAGVA